MKLSRRDFVPPIVLRATAAVKREIFFAGSTGLNSLDLKLIRAINPRKNGYFVELGANDGIRQSNTYKLQKSYGWSGLLVEPSPSRFRECVVNRDFANRPHVACAACVPFDFENPFVEIEDADLMSVAKGMDVKDEDAIAHADAGKKYLGDTRMRHSYGALARTLNSLLAEVGAPSQFDLLSLDVEGNELAVLKGLDFSSYRPSWILVEVRHDKVGDYLKAQGYQEYTKLWTCDQYADILYQSSSLI
mgnify:CR=1 FL=1